MDSIWKKTIMIPPRPRLKGEHRTQVLIVGGGLAGLLCARRLKEAGIDCCVVEAGRICGGATGNTTAKITAQHGLIYGELLEQFGREKARSYWELQEKTIREFSRYSQTLDCDYRETTHAVYASQNTASITEEAEALRTLNIPFEYAETFSLPVPVKGALRFSGQAQFHPLKFAAGISEGLELYECSGVREFTKEGAITDEGMIRTEATIIATHFPILNKHGSYFLKLYQERSYVLAVENAMDVEGMYLAAEKEGLSFRNFGSTLLIGSGGHRTGKKSNGWEKLERFVQKQFPTGKIIARWANQDCMTLDGLPYIGRYGKNTDNLYVATGFNKWGMTNAMAASMILSDLVQDRDNPYTELFSPQRSVLHPQLAWNVLESTRNLLTPTKPRCPHLGCALKWNPQEHSWDCPCHGSRFSETGKILDGPATGDLPE